MARPRSKWTESITIRLPNEVMDYYRLLADEELRPITNMCTKILVEHARTKGNGKMRAVKAA